MFRTLLIANRGEIACRIIRTARRMGIRTVAVYSEADAQARHVREADEAFCIGPAAAAKALMLEQNIPLTPGYHGADQNDLHLQTKADAIGYPVLIKPSAGGGGKGMHVVEKREDFLTHLAAARREAAASFGDERMLL